MTTGITNDIRLTNNLIIDQTEILDLNPSFWLNGAYASEFTKDVSEVISLWSDKGPNGLDVRNPTELNPSSDPTWIPNELNGLGVVRFDGDDSLIRENVLGSDLFSANEFTIFIVKKHAGLTSDFPFAWNFLGDRVTFNNPWGDGKVYFDTPLSARIFQDGHADKTDWAIWRFTRNSDTKSSVHYNRSLLFDGTFASITIPIAVSATLEISSIISTMQYAGDIAEVIVFPYALSDIQAYVIEQILSNKWFNGSI